MSRFAAYNPPIQYYIYILSSQSKLFKYFKCAFAKLYHQFYGVFFFVSVVLRQKTFLNSEPCLSIQYSDSWYQTDTNHVTCLYLAICVFQVFVISLSFGMVFSIDNFLRNHYRSLNTCLALYIKCRCCLWISFKGKNIQMNGNYVADSC